jgi:hypothetical protein
MTIKGTSPVHFVRATGFTIRRLWSTRSPRNRSRMRDRLLHPPRSSSPRRVGAPNHLRAAPRGVADFPDHQSHPAPSLHTSELCPAPPPLPAFLTSTWSSRPCQEGSPCALGAHGEHLAVVRAVAAHRRPRRGGRSTCACRHRHALCALQSAERALRPGQPHCHVGRTPRELGFGPKVV